MIRSARVNVVIMVGAMATPSTNRATVSSPSPCTASIGSTSTASARVKTRSRDSYA